MTVDRRRFLARSLAVGTGAWVAPQILTMRPASAESLTSPPPQRSGGGRGADKSERPGADQGFAAPASGQWHDLTTEGYTAGGNRDPAVALPRTGAEIATTAEVGLAAIVGGGLLRWWPEESE